MRRTPRLAWIGCAFLIASGCTGAPESAEGAVRDSLPDIVNRWLSVQQGSFDLEGYLALFAEDVAFRDAETGRTAHGRAELAEAVRSFTQLTDLSARVLRHATNEDQVFVEGELTARTPTGESVRSRGVVVFTVADSRITSLTTYLFRQNVAIEARAAERAAPLARQEIPRVWDEAALREFQLAPPGTDMRAEHVPPDYYYALPERPIYRTYPVYAPGREPAGYLDSLRTLEPEIVLDTDTLDTEAEWIRAGEMVFDTPETYLEAASGPFAPAALVRGGVPVAADGTLPFHRYVVVAKGDVRVGAGACSNCHLRVMPDGSVLKAVQGNYPLDRLVAAVIGMLQAGGPILRPGTTEPLTAAFYVSRRAEERFRAPWIDHASQAVLDTLSPERAAALHAAVPPGVLLRHGTNFPYPVKVPDLRGVRDQRFLDATGLIQQRSIGDLMRYAALTQSVALLDRYGDFVPTLGGGSHPLPSPASAQSFVNGPFTRFTDPQLLALAKYLYSLEPLPSPHEADAATLELGERIFIEEGCVTCHTPPLYTSNELTPAPGFTPPERDYERLPIFDVSVETDPGLALYTRRATGYYKVPSLRGLWYRERLFHDGSLSLEEVLDPARLENDFVPSGFRGADTPTRAVPGHPFGLELTPRERAALIAWLKTL